LARRNFRFRFSTPPQYLSADGHVRQNPVTCAVVVTDGTKELFRIPFVEAPGVLPKTN
jgi:hypothetical protein